MADVASLGIKIDSSQVKSATGDLKQLAGTAEATSGQMGAFETAAKRNNARFTEMAGALQSDTLGAFLAA